MAKNTENKVMYTQDNYYLKDKRSKDIAAEDQKVEDCLVLPMLLKSADRPFDDEEYLFEFKFDGVRMIADNRAKTMLYNRNKNIRTHIYPEIASQVSMLANGIVLDGEIIAIDKNGKQDFYKLLERDLSKGRGGGKDISFCFVAFDLLFLHDKDIRQESLQVRKQHLDSLLDSANCGIVKSQAYNGIGKLLYETAQKEGLEGIVAKRLTSKYYSGIRSGDWLKIKCFRYIDAFVAGYNISKSRPSLYLGIENDKGKLRYIGNVSNGLSNNQWIAFEERLKTLKTDRNYFSAHIDNEIVYVVPQIKLNIKYLEQEPNGKLRQPVINKVY